MIVLRLCMIALLLTMPLARADNLSVLDAAVEEAAAHNRAALAHLRANKLALAKIELVRLRRSFDLLVHRHGKRRRALRGNGDGVDLTAVMVDVPLRIVTAQIMVDARRPDIATRSLVAVCRALASLHASPESAPAAACEADASP